MHRRSSVAVVLAVVAVVAVTVIPLMRGKAVELVSVTVRAVSVIVAFELAMSLQR